MSTGTHAHRRTRSPVLQVLAFGLLALLAACGGSGGSDTTALTATTGGGTPPTSTPPAATATLDVTVYDNLGRFVSGATISTGAAQVDTDTKGHATIAVVTGSEQVLRIDKAGFAEQIKVVDLPASATSGQLRAMVVPRAASLAIASIEGGGTATGRDGVTVTFPAAALVDASGRAVSGTVDLLMTPLNVIDVDVQAFPGLFEGIPTGAARQAIVTYGTSELVPQQGGAKLALASGKTATIELPVYVKTHADGSTVKAGDTVPLWSLDTSTGLWMQEGSGTVVANAGSPTSLALRATIGHFSWWNMDAVAGRATVDLTVSATGGNVPAMTSAPTNATVVAGSGPSYTATTNVPVGSTSHLAVPAGATILFDTRFVTATQTCAGSVTVVAPAAGGTTGATLTATCTDIPVPSIVAPAPLSITNSATDTVVDIAISGPTPDTVELLVDGTSIVQMPGQAFYRAYWHSAAFTEGAHQLTARATLNGNTRTSAAVSVVVDRTPPQTLLVVPAPSVEVDASTAFTVTFSEPVNGLPFGLANAVRVTVLQPGQNQPTTVPFTSQLDATGTVLTVQPSAPFPFGIVGVSWGGLQDAAGNAVAGQVAATWSTKAFVRAGNLAFGGDGIAAAVDANGVLFALRMRPSDGNLEVVALGASGFTPVGPPVNDRAAASEGGGIAVGSNGQVWVAFSQDDGTGSGSDVRVRRFDAATQTWITPGSQTFQVGRFGQRPGIFPRVVLDSHGLPILAFVGSTGGQFDVQGFRFDGTNWVGLGSFGNTAFSAISLAVGPNDRPVVAFVRGFGGSNAQQLQVIRHDGASWVLLGAPDVAPSATEALSTPPALAIDPNGQPWVAWSHRPFVELRLVAFDGSAFQAITAPADFDAVNGVVGITFLNGDAILGSIVQAGSFDVRRLHNGGWGPPAHVESASQPGAVVLLPGGQAVLAISEGISGTALVDRVTVP